MSHAIKDGTGTGILAGVDGKNRLKTDSRAKSIQHTAAEDDQLAFQLPIAPTTLSSGTVVALHLQNGSAVKRLVITYIRHQIIDAAGGTSFPNASNYFRIAAGRTYSSGGSLVEPVNTFIDSGVPSEVVAYTGDPTLAGTAIDMDRWYTKADGDMNTFNKEGSIIIPPNKSLEFSYVGDRTSGIISLRVSFIMEED